MESPLLKLVAKKNKGIMNPQLSPNNYSVSAFCPTCKVLTSFDQKQTVIVNRAHTTDGVITEARRKRAHEDIRSLGNDVLHEDWREVTDDEVEGSHPIHPTHP